MHKRSQDKVILDENDDGPEDKEGNNQMNSFLLLGHCLTDSKYFLYNFLIKEKLRK